jgi:hypothetical protein
MSASQSGGPLVVFVLGSGRSGTSVVTHMLELLGSCVGPQQDLVGCGPHNPKGYFELQPIIDINDSILAAFGGTWDRPPDLGPGFESDPRVAPLRERALGYLGRAFGDSPAWVIKDPRLCHTLPFWRAITPGRHKYVLALRKPLEVAASLAKANGLSFQAAMAYWQLAVNAALRNSSGGERLMLFYEDIIEDWRTAMAHLAVLAERPESLGPQLEHDGESFVERSLRRERSTIAAQITHPEVPYTVGALYLSLRALVGLPEKAKAQHADLVAAIDAFAAATLETQKEIDALLAAYQRLTTPPVSRAGAPRAG